MDGSAEGAILKRSSFPDVAFVIFNAAPSALGSDCWMVDPRPYGQGYLMPRLRRCTSERTPCQFRRVEEFAIVPAQFFSAR
jgi:hypothetical protein